MESKLHFVPFPNSICGTKPFPLTASHYLPSASALQMYVAPEDELSEANQNMTTGRETCDPRASVNEPSTRTHAIDLFHLQHTNGSVPASTVVAVGVLHKTAGAPFPHAGSTAAVGKLPHAHPRCSPAGAADRPLWKSADPPASRASLQQANSGAIEEMKREGAPCHYPSFGPCCCFGWEHGALIGPTAGRWRTEGTL